MYKITIVTEEKSALNLLGFFDQISDKIKLNHICTENKFIMNNNFIKKNKIKLVTNKELLEDESIKFDILFNCLSTRILPDFLLKRASLFCLNLHFGILPEYAGTYPYVWAILNDCVEFGVTLHKMVKEVDTGDVLLEKRFTLLGTENAYTIFFKCLKSSIALMKDFTSIVKKQGITNLDFKQQNLENRTNYKLSDLQTFSLRPDWSLEKTRRYFRALDFSPTSSPFEFYSIISNLGKIEFKDYEIIDKSLTDLNIGEVKLIKGKYFIGCNGYTLQIDK